MDKKSHKKPKPRKPATKLRKQASPATQSVTARRPPVLKEDSVPVYEVRGVRQPPAAMDATSSRWDRARTQWQLGDWDSLAVADAEALQEDPRRAELAALAACAHLQKGNKTEARRLLAAASRWNCPPDFLARALAAGIENNMARYHEVCGRSDKAMQILASSAGFLGGDGWLGAKARKALDSARPSLRHTAVASTAVSHAISFSPSGQDHSLCENHSLRLRVPHESANLQASEPHMVTKIFQILIVDDGRIPTSLSTVLLNRITDLRHLHPQASYKLLDGNQIRAFLFLHFQPAVLDAYNNLRPYAYKADFARYCLLYIYGGLYVDLSICVKKRFNIPANYRIACFREPEVSSGSTCGIYNGIVYARPRCKEFAIAIDMILDNCRTKYYGVNPLAPTGPILFGRAIALANKLDSIYCGQSCISERQMAYYACPQGDIIAESTKIGGTDNSSWNAGKTNSYNDLWYAKNVYIRS